MRIAITGGTGFVGGHLARFIVGAGHEVVLLARGADRRDEETRGLEGVRFAAADVGDLDALTTALAGCNAVAHCAGINREIGTQTYERVHVEGTRNLVLAARRAGVGRIALVSFLRARPGCGSGYHESKWKAEEIVRGSGLRYTILRCGVIYGRGDHMLDHLSRAFHTFPFLPLVGLRDRRVRPVAVEDVARLLAASLVDGRLAGRAVAVLGPEEMSFREASRRVARVVGRRPAIFGAPVILHRLVARFFELTMKIPLASRAQVQILAEGLTEPMPSCPEPPRDLRPVWTFSEERIARGLPEAGPFTLRDCRWAA